MCWWLSDAFGNLLQKNRNEFREDMASLQAGMEDSRNNLEIQRFVGLEKATVAQSQQKIQLKNVFSKKKSR